MGQLVERVVPVRVKRNDFRPEITWTMLGRALRDAVESASGEAAA